MSRRQRPHAGRWEQHVCWRPTWHVYVAVILKAVARPQRGRAPNHACVHTGHSSTRLGEQCGRQSASGAPSEPRGTSLTVAPRSSLNTKCRPSRCTFSRLVRPLLVSGEPVLAMLGGRTWPAHGQHGGAGCTYMQQACRSRCWETESSIPEVLYATPVHVVVQSLFALILI